MKARLSKKQRIIFYAVGVLVVLIGWWAWGNYGPKPLGDKLEYLGKSDYGCIWICDSPPGSTYYYGTDMTPGEIVEYFRGARLERPIESLSGFVKSMTFTSKDSTFFYVYYKQSEDGRRKYTLEIDAKYYTKATNSL